MNIYEAANVLGVDLPTEKRLVKSAFRKLSLVLHPDVGGDPEKFMKAQAAFKLLYDNPDATREPDKVLSHTVDGTPLEELGLGYPLNVAAKTCENCEGLGYSVSREPVSVECKSCHGTGWKHVPCKRCSGTGQYRVNGEVRGPCWGCKGTGEFVPHDWAVAKRRREGKGDPWWVYEVRWPLSYYCGDCGGRGRRYDRRGKAYAVACDVCKGVGEVKMFNPVLSRGFLQEGCR